MLMFTEQKLLFSWWPVQHEKRKKRRPPSRDVLRAAETFLTWGSTSWDLHVELDGVHAQDGVSHVAEHVPAGCHAHKSGQLLQLLKLRLPPGQKEQVHSFHADLLKTRTNLTEGDRELLLPFRVREIDVGAKLDDLPHWFLLSAVRGGIREILAQAVHKPACLQPLAEFTCWHL